MAQHPNSHKRKTNKMVPAHIVRLLKVLNLPSTSFPTTEAIKRAYHTIALATHPDKNPNSATATAKFQNLKKIYDELLSYAESHDANSKFVDDAVETVTADFNRKTTVEDEEEDEEGEEQGFDISRLPKRARKHVEKFLRKEKAAKRLAEIKKGIADERWAVSAHAAALRQQGESAGRKNSNLLTGNGTGESSKAVQEVGLHNGNNQVVAAQPRTPYLDRLRRQRARQAKVPRLNTKEKELEDWTLEEHVAQEAEVKKGIERAFEAQKVDCAFHERAKKDVVLASHLAEKPPAHDEFGFKPACGGGTFIPDPEPMLSFDAKEDESINFSFPSEKKVAAPVLQRQQFADSESAAQAKEFRNGVKGSTYVKVSIEDEVNNDAAKKAVVEKTKAYIASGGLDLEQPNSSRQVSRFNKNSRVNTGAQYEEFDSTTNLNCEEENGAADWLMDGNSIGPLQMIGGVFYIGGTPREIRKLKQRQFQADKKARYLERRR